MQGFDEYAYLEQQLTSSDPASRNEKSSRRSSERYDDDPDRKRHRSSSHGHAGHHKSSRSNGSWEENQNGGPGYDGSRRGDWRSGRDRERRRGGHQPHAHRKRSPGAKAATDHERELKDLDRDIRTVFAYNINPKATERDVFEFFSKAGRVSDVKMIMDRSTKRCKGFAYIELAKQEFVLNALSLTGQMLLGQAIMVKSSEAEKNMAWEAQQQAAASNLNSQLLSGAPCKLLLTNLRLEISEADLRPLFEPFGEVDLVQVARDSAGNSKGSAHVQFKSHTDATRAMQQWNGRDLAGLVVKITIVPPADSAGMLPGLGELDEDDEAGGGLRLTSQTRAALMNRLANSAGLQVPAAPAEGSSGAATGHPNGSAVSPLLPSSIALEQGLLGPASPIPTVCLLLKNMFDPGQETEPNWDKEIANDVQEECGKFGAVVHVHVDPNSKGFVYLKFATVDGCRMAQQKLHGRFFAGKSIAAEFQFTQPYNSLFKC